MPIIFLLRRYARALRYILFLISSYKLLSFLLFWLAWIDANYAIFWRVNDRLVRFQTLPAVPVFGRWPQCQS